MPRGPIHHDTFGTADFVTEIFLLKSIQWGGFEVELTCDARFEDREGAPILVRAKAWTGIQPRLVLIGGDEGYDDWRELLDAQAEHRKTLRVVGSAEASRDAWAQWKTHGPSKLLGGKKFTFVSEVSQ